MATVDTQIQKAKEIHPTEVTHLAEVAETVRDDALQWSRAGLGVVERDLGLEHLFKRANFVDRFKYGLAKGVAQSIAANDQRVQAIHLFEPQSNPDLDTGDDLPIEAAVHLLVQVSASSPALEAFIASLDRALINRLRELPTDLFASREWILDAKLITEDDVRDNRGYACLLGSTFSPALKIWPQNP